MRRRRVAVVGGGVSGLVAAHALRDACEVTLLEAAPLPGGHANTVEVTPPGGAPTRVDTGFIVLNDRNYPRFEALLADLGVATQPSDMSFGVSDDRGFAYASHSLRGLFAVPRHAVSPRFLRMVLDVPRFQREARALLAGDADPSLRGWLASLELSEDFVERIIVPQAAAVWSADPEQMWTFPARFLVRFFANHGMLGLRDRPAWRTVVGGSRTYVDALAARLGGRVRCSARVIEVRRTDEGVEVVLAGRGAEPERFDEVVLAGHADESLAVLADASDAERALLEAFPSQVNDVVLHTDTSVLPRQRAAWASWNVHLDDEPLGVASLTYDMTRLQSLPGPGRLLVTMNRTEAIDPALVLSRHAYAHPVFTREGTAAQERHGAVSGNDHVHFAGAYWRWGFHEDGVVSGERAAAAVLEALDRDAVAA